MTILLADSKFGALITLQRACMCEVLHANGSFLLLGAEAIASRLNGCPGATARTPVQRKAAHEHSPTAGPAPQGSRIPQPPPLDRSPTQVRVANPT